MGYTVEVKADTSGKWCGNGREYDGVQEAEAAAWRLFLRWNQVLKMRIVEAGTGAFTEVL